MSTKGTSRESVVGLPNVKERNSAHLLTRTDMLVVRHACGGAREMQQVGGQAYGQMMVGGKKLSKPQQAVGKSESEFPMSSCACNK